MILVIVILAILAIEGSQGPPFAEVEYSLDCPRVHLMVPLPCTNPTPCSLLRHPILFSQGAQSDKLQLNIAKEDFLEKTGQLPH